MTYTQVVPLEVVDFHGQMHRYDAFGTLGPNTPRFKCFAASGALGRVVLVYDNQEQSWWETPLAAVATAQVARPKAD